METIENLVEDNKQLAKTDLKNTLAKINDRFSKVNADMNQKNS